MMDWCLGNGEALLGPCEQGERQFDPPAMVKRPHLVSAQETCLKTNE